MNHNSDSIRKKNKIEKKVISLQRNNKVVEKNEIVKPKFSVEDSKMKMMNLRAAMELAKENRQKEAKELREKNRLIRENIAILKYKIL